MSALPNPSSTNIREIPADPMARTAIRTFAAELVTEKDHTHPPTREELESSGRAVLKRLDFGNGFLGYAMVAVNNAWWRQQFESIPYNRRLLLLPHCMSDNAKCLAQPDSNDFHCANCGACDIGGIKAEAESLGYEVITAEGTTSALMKILHGDADAILGVACMESLERSYSRVADLGIAHVAIPLLHNGCVNTKADMNELMAMLHSTSDRVVTAPKTYLPLLRKTVSLFDMPSLSKLLPLDVGGGLLTIDSSDPAAATESIAFEWLSHRGKRLRPFLTASAYAVARFGSDVLAPDADLSTFIPDPIKKIAVAIEALHKASLIHDDIEDDDEYRYGRKTIHKEHGIPPAINIGDYLVGLGYNLIAGESANLGVDCATDILRRLSSAHLDLCRGQGAELLWKNRPNASLQPIDALSIYALKTAPALEVALYAGLRAAGVNIDSVMLRQFCTYLGEGYQVLNDLDDWQPDGANRVVGGGDVLADRPTILKAFALESGGNEVLHSLIRPDEASTDMETEVERLRELYIRLGAFDRAEILVDRLRERSIRLTGNFQSQPLRELMRFLVSLILPARRAV